MNTKKIKNSTNGNESGKKLIIVIVMRKKTGRYYITVCKN